MLAAFTPIHLLYLLLAIALEVAANVLMKMSHGFKHKIVGIIAILFALAAFTSLSFAIDGIQLSIAYAVWGGVGMIATALLGIYLFRETLTARGWVGVLCIVMGVFFLKFA